MRVVSLVVGGSALAIVLGGAFVYYGQFGADARQADEPNAPANVQVAVQSRAPGSPGVQVQPTRPPQPTGPRRGPPGARPPVPVQSATVIKADAPVTMSAFGTIQAYSTVAIKAQIDGQIVRVHFTEGSRVKKGDLLFTIDPRPFEAALRAVEAARARNIALLEKARQDLRRYSELSAREFASRARYEEAQANAAALEASLKADLAQIEMARLRLDYTQIRSPIDGRTGNVLITAGNLVKANDATLVVLNQQRPIYASFAVPESRLAEVRGYMGSRNVAVRVFLPDQVEPVATGRLTFINNAVDPTTGTIQLKATFENAEDHLRPGQFVTAELRLDTIAGALVLPAKAVQIGQRDGRTFRYVYVIKPDNTVSLREVETGVPFADKTVIRRGVEPGERVVTVGQLRLRPGARVRIDTGARRMRPRGRN